MTSHRVFSVLFMFAVLPGWQGRGLGGEILESSGTYDHPHLLKYYGYSYLGDVLNEKETLRELRTFTNTVALFTKEHSLRGRLPKKMEGVDENTVRALTEDREVLDFLHREGERISFLDSLGFTVIWSLPLSDLIRENRLGEFKQWLGVIQENLPQMSKVDYVYFYDEPDINSEPGAEALERFIDEFKTVFPEVKVTICYAIVQPKYFSVRPPRNVDLLGIDPYMHLKRYAHTAADFEHYYRHSCEIALNWVNRWNRPYIIVGDCMASLSDEGKKMPSPESTLWYYQIALTQPQCVGVIWSFYGGVIESEHLKGFTFEDDREGVGRVQREIGQSILGEPSTLGLPGVIKPPPRD